MKLRNIAGLATGIALTVSAPASAMSVADFLAKANALQAKGMAAMFSPDLKLVMREFKAAGPAYRADVAKARAEGRNDLGCPTMAGKFGVNSTAVIAEFSAIPPAEQRTTSVRQAFYAMMKKRFPCR